MKIGVKSLRGVIGFVAALFVITGGTAAFAQESQYEVDASAAQAYADAYGARDIAAMSPLLSENAVFEDPSNYFEGKEAIVEGLAEVFNRVTATGPDTREINKYRSGNHFVYMAWIDFNVLMAAGDQPEREFTFKLDFMMTLKVENGKIVEHRDYLDTEAFVAQLQAQMTADKD